MKKAFLCILSATLMLGLVACAQPAITEDEQAVSIATKHLQKYGHYPPVVLRVEVEEGEGEANDYWSRFDQPPIQSPAKRQCYIVRFYYPGPAEGSHLVVFVDKKSGEVIGGTQTR